MNVLSLEALGADERQQLINRPSPLNNDIKARAKEIIDAVRKQGDEALKTLTQSLDQAAIDNFRVPPSEFHRAFDRANENVRAALGQAKLQLERFHEPQAPEAYELKTLPGITLGRAVRPFERVGVYVPKNLVSSLLMAAVPARIAGVCRLMVCTPPLPDGTVPDALLAACSLLDVEALYTVGGVQAIAALAYGTESVERVSKIVGPGNAYVTAAKALVRDDVGIDLLAGPSEVLLVIEPDQSHPLEQLTTWALAELRAQLEHGTGASAVLLTSSSALAASVSDRLEPQEYAQRNLAIVRYNSLEGAIEFANQYAPEHLCLWGAKAEAKLPAIQHAGSVFLGPWSPVALGDYTSGTNHVLPTSGQARLTGGLSVRDFYKTISYQRLSAKGLSTLADTAIALAELEGMPSHAHSVRVRTQEVDQCGNP